MGDESTGAPQRILVISDSYVVQADLCDYLQSGGWGEVDVRCALSDVWSPDYAVAIMGVAVEDALGDARVKAMFASGAHVIILNGHLPDEVYAGTGLHPLAVPFRTDDVESLLVQLGVSRKAG